jgi:hypothetical protein
MWFYSGFICLQKDQAGRLFEQQVEDVCYMYFSVVHVWFILFSIKWNEFSPVKFILRR